MNEPRLRAVAYVLLSTPNSLVDDTPDIAITANKHIVSNTPTYFKFYE